MKTKLMLATLMLGTSALVAGAQETPGDNQSGPPSRGHRPPPPAIIKAIDANHDGVIDADEITNAAAVLKTLDKNGDGVLTPDEFAGKPPRRPSSDGADRPPMDGMNRPDGAGFDGPPGSDFAGPPDGMPPGPPPGGE
jgi:EF hand